MKFVRALLVLALSAATQAQPVTNSFLKGEYAIPNLGVAKNLTREYCRSQLYKDEVTYVANRAKDYLEVRLQAPVDGKPAIVFDIDETCLSNFPYMDEYDFAFQNGPWNAWIDKAIAPPLEGSLDLYKYARSKSLAVIFISGRNQMQRLQTENNLRQAGFEDWAELILKDIGSTQTTVAFKSDNRKRLVQAGYNILVNIGDQDSDLQGGYAESTFKIPNPMYWVP
ncbi:MAG: HAD family acid phosphatase [Candidatus Eremiobacteraeota bacterium]|nr:HAD family acid phosphatase [Candidatus Eremiobacteraeota bacterium]MCW5871733.1 HAD family acid phosphatase [Candidatus Eremiobacteraeota bacterium]